MAMKVDDFVDEDLFSVSRGPIIFGPDRNWPANLIVRALAWPAIGIKNTMIGGLPSRQV